MGPALCSAWGARMNNEQFLDFFYQDFQLHLGIIAACLVIYSAIFWRACRSLADPLAFGVLAQAMAASVVFMLRAGGEIADVYFYSFIACELALLAGCFLLGAPRLQKAKALRDARTFDIVHHCFLAVFWLSSLAFLSKAGLLLFTAESRLVVMQNLGALSWFVDVCWVAVPILVMMRWALLGKRTRLDVVSLAACILFLLTKGGKSDFIILVFSAYLVAFIGRNERALLWARRSVLAVPFVLLAITAITLLVWGQSQNPLISVLQRLVFFGDVLYQGYTDDFMHNVQHTSALNYFFHSISAFVDSLTGQPAEERVVLGYEMALRYYGIEEGIGPNARANILGFYLFGPYGAVVFCFFVGAAFAALRRGLRMQTYTGMLVYCLANVFAMYVFIDPALAAGYFLKLAVVLGTVFTLALAWVGFRPTRARTQVS